MNLYLFRVKDIRDYYVEAPDMVEALRLWLDEVVDPADDDGLEPDSITCVSEWRVLRAAPVSVPA